MGANLDFIDYCIINLNNPNAHGQAGDLEGYEREMKRIIRKTSFGVSVTYKNGNFSNNLNGKNATILVENNVLYFTIDLSPNLRVKNKAANCFYDINELADDHLLLDTLQIDDDGILKGLAKVWKNNQNANLQLQLDIAEKGFFKFLVSVSGSSGSVLFTFQEAVEHE